MLPLIALVLAGMGTWQLVLQSATVRVERAAEMLREHARSIIGGKDLAIAAAEFRAGGLSWQDIRTSRDLYDFLVMLDTSSTLAGGIAFVDPGGRLAMSSIAPMPGAQVDLSMRDYVRAHPAGSGLREAPFIGEVVVTRPSGFLGFPVARQRRGADGNGDGGNVVATLPSSDLQAFYAGIRETPGDSVMLLRVDGAVLAAVPPPQPAEGARLPEASAAALRRLRDGPPAVEWSRLSGDGQQRLTALRHVPGLGVAVAYGLAPEALRQDWLRRMVAPLAGAVGGMLLLGALVLQTERALFARAEADARSRRAERQATLGLLSGGLAHDFGNITQSVLAAAHLLGKHAGNPDRVRVIGEHLARHAERAAALSRRMLDQTRRSGAAAGGSHGRVAVSARLRELSILLNATLGAGIRVRCDVPPDLFGRGFDPAELETALINLAANSRDAMPRGGEVRIAAERVALPADQAASLSLPAAAYLRVMVEDDGIGMDAATLRRFGEAFFTTKPEGQGTGLGVAMAAAFVRAAGGAIRADSAPGRGSRVTLYVPAA
ncbi:ATP-binding protein [Falsiroseomonas sp. CW058]|uniref:ATP-binding protein n=1 Tax=Falsiroseomonas sp. CW058 TaxID=3388664 RepID=UPI003D314339